MNSTEQSIIAEQYINDCYPSCSDIDKQELTICFHAGANWQASQHSYTEQKLRQALTELLSHAPSVDELGGKTPSPFDNSFKRSIINAEDILKGVTNCDTRPTYTQEQMLAFGEKIKAQAADITLRWNYASGADQEILNIDTNKILPK